MRFLRKLLLPVLALASLALARSSTGDSVLVVLDPSLKKDNFSIFFGDLESTCRHPKPPELSLILRVLQSGVTS